jgi:hypothetical protein
MQSQDKREQAKRLIEQAERLKQKAEMKLHEANEKLEEAELLQEMADSGTQLSVIDFLLEKSFYLDKEAESLQNQVQELREKFSTKWHERVDIENAEEKLNECEAWEKDKHAALLAIISMQEKVGCQMEKRRKCFAKAQELESAE